MGRNRIICGMLALGILSGVSCGGDDRRDPADGGSDGGPAADCTVLGCVSGFECNTETMRCERPGGSCIDVGCPAGQTCNETTGMCEPVTTDCESTGCPAGTSCNTTTGLCEEKDDCVIDVIIRQSRRCDPATTACITDGGDVGDCIAMDLSPAVCRPCIENNILSCGNMLGCQDQWDVVACCRDEQCGGTFDPACRDDTCSGQWADWTACFDAMDFTQCYPHISDCADTP